MSSVTAVRTVWDPNTRSWVRTLHQVDARTGRDLDAPPSGSNFGAASKTYPFVAPPYKFPPGDGKSGY